MITMFSKFINESFSLPKKVTIEEFVDNLRLPLEEKDVIIDWWNNNRKRFNIHFFKFNTKEPICGVFIDENTIAVNSREVRMLPELLLYIMLHESRHADQEIRDKFSQRYFDTVVNNDKEAFLKGYKELESDANDYACESMKEMGYGEFISKVGKDLRRNEQEGEKVWKMMREDIKKFDAKTFSELIFKQIL